MKYSICAIKEFSLLRHNRIHIHIHNRPLQSFSQDYGLASHTTHVVWVNFIREWLDLQFNVDSQWQIFVNIFHGRFIYSQSFCQKFAERKSPSKYISYFNFDDWPGIRTHAFVSNKPTYYLLDHVNFLSTNLPVNNGKYFHSNVWLGWPCSILHDRSKHIIDSVLLYFTNCFTNIVL